MEVNIFQVDAFSSKPFGGNPTIIVPNAKWISNEDRQKIANEMNVSYTTFVQQMGDERFKVSFFTPKREVKFSGHGTIATFYAMAEMGYISPLYNGIKTAVMETNIGKYPVEISYRNNKVHRIIMQLDGPGDRGEVVDGPVLLHSLNLDRLQIGMGDFYYPPEIISTGLPYIILPLKERETLDRLNLDEFCSLLEYCKAHDVAGVHAFHMPELNSDKVYSRNFSPLIDIHEEPVSGIAAGALIYYLKKHKLIESNEITSIQGFSMNRPSEAYCYLEEEDGIFKVKVGGSANIVLEGILKY